MDSLWGKTDPTIRLKRDISSLEDRANGLWQLIQDLKSALGANETELSPSGDPTFARVITPRIDNGTATIQINPNGGAVEVGNGLRTVRTSEASPFDQNISNTYANGSGRTSLRLFVNNSYTPGTPKEVFRADYTGDVEFNGGKVTNSGFTKSGSDAPATKKKKLTGTTASTQGADVSVNHGLTRSKIISCLVQVDGGTNWFYGEFHRYVGYQFSTWASELTVNVGTVTGNSINILSKPFTVLIEYEE